MAIGKHAGLVRRLGAVPGCNKSAGLGGSAPVSSVHPMRQDQFASAPTGAATGGAADGEPRPPLLARGRVRKVVCPFPSQVDFCVFDDLYRTGRIELEVVPQGGMAERLRAAGAGIGAFFCPTGVATPLAEGKETREIDGRTYVLEYPIRGDVALIGAYRADRAGNLPYRKTARHFGPVLATAAATTVVQVGEVVDVGGIDPEAVITPGIYVDRVVVAWAPSAAPGDPGVEKRWPPRSPATPPTAPTSTSASASPPGSPTHLLPVLALCCTPRTACSAWAVSPWVTRSTLT